MVPKSRLLKQKGMFSNTLKKTHLNFSFIHFLQISTSGFIQTINPIDSTLTLRVERKIQNGGDYTEDDK